MVFIAAGVSLCLSSLSAELRNIVFSLKRCVYTDISTFSEVRVLSPCPIPDLYFPYPAVQTSFTKTRYICSFVESYSTYNIRITTILHHKQNLCFLSLDCSVPLRVCNQNILIKITCINSFLLSVCLSI